METRDILFIFSGQLAGKGIRELSDYLDAKGIKLGPIKAGDLIKGAAVIGGIYYALKGKSYTGQTIGALAATNILAEWLVDIISGFLAPKAAAALAPFTAPTVRVRIRPTPAAVAKARPSAGFV